MTEALTITVAHWNRIFSDFKSFWSLNLLRGFAKEVLIALDFLHTEAKLIHCGEQLQVLRFPIYLRL